MEDFCREFWKDFWDINIKDVVYILATIITVTVAIVGYNKWKKELRWKTYFDFAHRFLKTAYALRDAFKFEREKIFYLPMHLQAPPVNTEEANWDIIEFHKKFYNESLSQIQEAAVHYQSLLTEGEVLFDRAFRDPADRMVELVQRYKRAIDEHLQYKYSMVGFEDYHITKEQYQNDILPLISCNNQQKEPDTFGQSIDWIIEELDRILIRHIRPSKKE